MKKYIFLCCCVVFQHLYTPRLLFYFDEDRPAGKLTEFSVHIKNQRFPNLCACDGLIWSIVNDSPLQGANRRVVTKLLEEIFSNCFIWILTPRSRTTVFYDFNSHANSSAKLHSLMLTERTWTVVLIKHLILTWSPSWCWHANIC